MLVLLLSSAHGFGLRELPNDGTDQDGDGGDAIRQDFRATFPKPMVPPLTGWVATGGASFGNDVATVPAFGHVTWSGAASFQAGEVNLVLDTDLILGTCTVAVTWHELSPPSGPYSNTFSITSPTLVSTLTANAPISVDAIDLGCGLGQMTVDWLVFQNGVEVYPPVGDIDITWEDVDKPGGGYESAVTLRGTIEDDPMSPISLWAASDVGGIAQWSDVDHAWKTRNGTWPDMLYQASELAMFDIVETAFNEVLAISGEIDTVEGCDALGDCHRMVRGRLMASSDAGGSWIAEADTYQSPGSGTPVVAANRRLSPFVDADGDWAKTHAAGRLLEHAEGSVFVANHVPATSDAPAGFPPLVLREDGPAGFPADICALSNGDPTLELPRATYDEVTGWHNILSALAWIGEPGQETLLVGVSPT